MKAQEATHKAPIKFALRRARQVVLLLRLRLDVLMAVEVGTPTEAKQLGTMLKAVGSSLRLVPHRDSRGRC